MLDICCIYTINVIKIFIDKILNIHVSILYTYILCNKIIYMHYYIYIHNIVNVIYIARTINLELGMKPETLQALSNGQI